MKTRCLSLALTCLACLLLAIGICPAGASDDVSPVPALVSDADKAGTNLRSAPSGEVLGVLPFSPAPRLVLVLDSQKGWFRVKPFPIEEYELEGASTAPAEGWMHGSVLALCPCPSEDGDPWLYTAPRWDAETDIRVPGAVPLRPLERRGEWFKVRAVKDGKAVERWLHEQQVSASAGELLEYQSRVTKGWKK
ncbi:MAG: hypothetical protein IKY97_08105 [Mailhella sp.]|nr:hypothetical protein [Mailhella sp.]